MKYGCSSLSDRFVLKSCESRNSIEILLEVVMLGYSSRIYLEALRSVAFGSDVVGGYGAGGNNHRT